MKRLVITLLALLALSVTVFAQGQSASQRQGGQRPMGGAMMTCPSMAIMPPQSGMIDRLAQVLGLTDEQKSNLKTIVAENQKTLEPLLKKASESTKAFAKSVITAEYDSENTKTLRDQAVEAESDIIAANLKTWEEIRAILTADQLTKYQQMIGAMSQGPGQRFGGGPQGAGQPGGDGMMPPPPGGFPGGAPPEPPTEQ